jgi:hypothetical protein
MARKKVVYRPTRPKKGPPPSPGPIIPPSSVTIDTTAGLGRQGIVVGSRVTILGGGLYAGEVAVVERLVGGVIPAALVRTEAGRTRQVRTVDLEPVGPVARRPVAAGPAQARAEAPATAEAPVAAAQPVEAAAPATAEPVAAPAPTAPEPVAVPDAPAAPPVVPGPKAAPAARRPASKPKA